MRAAVLSGALCCLVAGACARPEPATAQQLRSRAAFELECPPEQIGLVRIDESTGGVIACGRRVVYVENCVGRTRCTWSFDHESVPPVGSVYGRLHRSRISTLPKDPVLAAQPDPWRGRVPALSDDDPGF